VGVALAVAVADGVGVSVGVGLGVEHIVKSVVQEAPSDGQQKFVEPQKVVAPTLVIVEQLISLGGSPASAE